jgi:hypothetical protein
MSIYLITSKKSDRHCLLQGKSTTYMRANINISDQLGDMDNKQEKAGAGTKNKVFTNAPRQ